MRTRDREWKKNVAPSGKSSYEIKFGKNSNSRYNFVKSWSEFNIFVFIIVYRDGMETFRPVPMANKSFHLDNGYSVWER